MSRIRGAISCAFALAVLAGCGGGDTAYSTMCDTFYESEQAVFAHGFGSKQEQAKLLKVYAYTDSTAEMASGDEAEQIREFGKAIKLYLQTGNVAVSAAMEGYYSDVCHVGDGS